MIFSLFKKKDPERRILHRGNLRDVVILLSAVLAGASHLDTTGLAAGLGFLALGTGLNFITKGILVRNTVLCNRGVYRFCRHPYYLSNFLVDISICILSGNRYLILAYPFLFFWAYGPTFAEEERRLFQLYPDSYRESLLNTPQVFPTTGFWTGLKEIGPAFSWRRITPTELIRVTRFWAIAMILLLIHEIQEEGWATVRQYPIDRDLGVILILAGSFLGAGVIVQCWGAIKKNEQIHDHISTL